MIMGSRCVAGICQSLDRIQHLINGHRNHVYELLSTIVHMDLVHLTDCNDVMRAAWHDDIYYEDFISKFAGI